MDKKGHSKAPGSIPAQPDKKSGTSSSKSLSKKILQNISKSYTGEETAKFIVHLGESLQPHPSEEPAFKLDDDCELKTPALSLLERLFDDFVRYHYEFTKTPVGADVAVECVRPSPPKEAIQLAPGETPVLAEGTLVVGGWTMPVQAHERKIRVFIIPKNYLSGFHGRQTFFSPFVEMQASIHNGQTVWRVDEHRLSKDDLAKLSKQLFGAIVKVNAGEVSANERFRMDTDEGLTIGRLLPEKSEKIALQSLPHMRPYSGDKHVKGAGEEEQHSSIKAGSVLEFEANKAAVLSAFESFSQSLDYELNRLSRIEREGVRLDDMKIVEQALSRAGQLRPLIEQIRLALDKWQHVPSEGIKMKR